MHYVRATQEEALQPAAAEQTTVTKKMAPTNINTDDHKLLSNTQNAHCYLLRVLVSTKKMAPTNINTDDHKLLSNTQNAHCYLLRVLVSFSQCLGLQA